MVSAQCGYDFNRLGRSRILKDGHWDILTTDKRLLSQNIFMMKNDIQILKYQEYKDAVNEDTEENINL